MADESLTHRRCWCANTADGPILLMCWSCWCTDPAGALMLLMLLNQDQDLSTAICSSFLLKHLSLFGVRAPEPGVLKVLQIVGVVLRPPSPPRHRLSLQTPSSNWVMKREMEVGWGLFGPFYRPQRVHKPLGQRNCIYSKRHDIPVWSSKPNWTSMPFQFKMSTI